MTSLGYPDSLRLLTAAEFKRVMDGAAFKASHHAFLLLAVPSERSTPRLGFIVARKKARRAVDRNRIKRCMRENFRLMQADIPPMDIVFLARQDVARLDNVALHAGCQDALRKLIRKAKSSPPAGTGKSVP